MMQTLLKLVASSGASPFRIAIVAATVWSIAQPIRAQSPLETLAVQGQVHVLAGPNGNTVVQTGNDGVLVVDPQGEPLADSVLAGIRALTPRDIRYVVLTSAGPQQTGNAGRLAKAGRNVRLLDSVDPRGGDARASIIAHVNLLHRMSATGAAADSWPTDTYFTADWSIFSNGEAVQFLHAPQAVTGGDSLVFFRRSDVVSTGPLFDAVAYPRFDPEAGGSINGIIEGLNHVMDLAIAGANQEGGTVVVPGRGRLGDETDVANYRDMVTIVRDRVRDMLARGLTLEQAQRERPTADYDGLYAPQGAEWTADRFVEAVYLDLARTRP